MAEPSCSDGIANGSETGIDCGGSECDSCTSCSLRPANAIPIVPNLGMAPTMPGSYTSWSPDKFLDAIDLSRAIGVDLIVLFQEWRSIEEQLGNRNWQILDGIMNRVSRNGQRASLYLGPVNKEAPSRRRKVQGAQT